MKYRDMTPEQKEKYKKRQRKWRAENPDKYQESQIKWKTEHHEEYKSHRIDVYRKRKAENPDKYREYQRNYKAEDINKNGVTKNRIRSKSNLILFKNHTKLQGYEIHHCFGYEDPNKFIYIPKSLHIKIHQLLRYKKIPAESDHWNTIRDLVNICEEYTYIRT